MKLDPNAIISEAKVSRYLLQWRPGSDKSGFLYLAGYDALCSRQLALDIRNHLLPLKAEFLETTEYGDKFRIRGRLTGPNGRSLQVSSIWMIESATGNTKFLTLYPDKVA
jgi:hypothetical protein